MHAFLIVCLAMMAQADPATERAREETDYVAIRGRAVDEDLAPLSNAQLSAAVLLTCVTATSSSSGNSNAAGVTTSDDGTFTMRIFRHSDNECSRTLVIRPETTVVPGAHELQPVSQRTLPNSIPGSEFDVGVLRLSAPASPRRYLMLSDDELELLAKSSLKFSTNQSERQLESALTEMARRGGQRFEEFLRAELERIRALPDFPVEIEPDLDLYLLAALRRLQRKPDPLTVEVPADAVLVSDFPSSPVFAAQLVNTDALKADFHVANGGGYRSGRLERWRVEVRTTAGSRLAPRRWESGWGGGMHGYELIAHGAKLSAAIPIANYVTIDEPGTYEVRVLYHDRESIAELHDLGNLFCAQSKWMRIEIRPRTIRSTKADDRRARDAVGAVTGQPSVSVFKVPFDPEHPYTPKPTSNEEILFSLGWKSLPALFDALGDTKRTPHQHAWELAQLYNLTGLCDPLLEKGIVGDADRIAGPVKGGNVYSSMFLELEAQRGPIDEAKQRAFAERWKRVSRGFRFEITD